MIPSGGDLRPGGAIVERLRGLVPPTVIVEGGDLDPEGDILFEEEDLLVRKSVPQRRREFRAGRVYARRALRRLGASDMPLLPGKTRAPQWPLGTVGSITHTRQVCAVAAARSSEFAAIGVDIEDFTALSADGVNLRSMVATKWELERTTEVESRLGVDVSRLLFVIKEAVYKAYAPLTGIFLDYLDVEVELDLDAHAFRPRLTRSESLIPYDIRNLSGRFAIDREHVLAYASAGLGRVRSD